MINKFREKIRYKNFLMKKKQMKNLRRNKRL